MDSEESTENCANTVVDSIISMFGDVLSREVIATVVESCGGDPNISADAIFRIINDTNCEIENVSTTSQTKNQNQIKNKPIGHETNSSQNLESTSHNTEPVSYAAAFQRTGAMPKQQIKTAQPSSKPTGWSEQFCRIVSYHNQGFCILILMRGVPGSGKSFLARNIIETTVGSRIDIMKTHICSTDDYFVAAGRFNKYELPFAHDWNQKRAAAAIAQGLSPVIIDNTNVEIWEMEPYVRKGVANGYIIEVMEPTTPWAKKPYQLFRRNIHDVPIITIKRMLDNYVDGITGESLVKQLGLSYPADRVPPVIRSMPLFQPALQQVSTSASMGSSSKLEESNPTFNKELQSGDMLATNAVANLSLNETAILQPVQAQDDHIAPTTMAANNPTNNTTMPIDNSIIPAENSTAASGSVTFNDDKKQKKYLEVQKQLEEIEKFEQEWESGENWIEEQNELIRPNNLTNNTEITTPKPQRKQESLDYSEEKLLRNVNNTEDWSQISMFMPPWNSQESTSQFTKLAEIPVEKINGSTCMEMGDIENYGNMLKVLTTYSRDINQFNISINKQKIPEIQMLDKSTSTNEHFITNPTNRCHNEERHFKELRKLFKHIPKTALREIFEKCMGDVNWAVEIVLDGMASNQIETIENEKISDEEDNALSSEDLCSCLAAYNILPDRSETHPSLLSVPSNEETPPVASGSSPKVHCQKKTKKENNTSEDTKMLKNLIEKNVDFSENHYSQHCLKIRKFRRGESEVSEGTNIETSDMISKTEPSYQDTASCLPIDDKNDDDSNISIDDVEKTVVFNLGNDFISELDMLFGRRDMTYPDEVMPKINIPLSLLNEINALWMESLMNQLDEQDKQKRMLAEDEELARRLSLKEEELAAAGIEPAVPDFKEIMDMDFAISLYQKDVDGWRIKAPDDLAARLTRDKLYNLFPDISKDILLELLMAHDNNFQNTVEVLLMSTGRTDILEKENGMNRFIMQKEMERQKRILEEEKKRALSEVEWPLLPRGEVVEMSVVQDFRDKAEQHLESRNRNHQKAKEYIRRGMIQAANYYCKVAEYHKMKYEQNNSMAAVSLMQVHASNCPDTATIDLHYLRVAEAKEALDLFLDTHIHKLRENQGREPRFHNLFFITGRGLHSNGGPRIKPAVKNRLHERGLAMPAMQMYATPISRPMTTMPSMPAMPSVSPMPPMPRMPQMSVMPPWPVMPQGPAMPQRHALPPGPAMPQRHALPPGPAMPQRHALPPGPAMPQRHSLPPSPTMLERPALPPMTAMPPMTALPPGPAMPQRPALPPGPAMPQRPSLPPSPTMLERPALPPMTALPPGPAMPQRPSLPPSPTMLERPALPPMTAMPPMPATPPMPTMPPRPPNSIMPPNPAIRHWHY